MEVIMTYKFVDIASLFERFAVDAFDIVSGMKEAEKEYKGFFGDSPREIYAKVVQNKVETKVFVRVVDRHEYGFATDTLCTMYRYFLPLDALNELKKDYVSLDDLEENKSALDNFLYKFGRFSNQEDFSSSKVGTLVGSNENSLIGISDEGEKVYGIFFRPLRKDEGLTIKGIKVPVPDLNINPIPSLPKDAVDKAIENFDKEVEKSEKSDRMEKIHDRIRRRSNAFYGMTGKQDVQYSVYKDKLYKYIGDFKYEDQIKEIMEEFDWCTVAQMARIKYRSLESPKANYPDESLISMFKEDAERMLRELIELNCNRVACGLFTVYNDGGVLSLEFTPEGWEGSSDEEDSEAEEIELNRIKF
jgi:hypothetical protein